MSHEIVVLVNLAVYVCFFITMIVIWLVGECPPGFNGPKYVLPFTPVCTYSDCNFGVEWEYATLVQDCEWLRNAWVMALICSLFVGIVFVPGLALGAAIGVIASAISAAAFFAKGFGWPGPPACVNPDFPFRLESICLAKQMVPHCLPRRPIPGDHGISLCLFGLCVNAIFTGILMAERARVNSL